MSSIYHVPTPYNRSCTVCGEYKILYYFDAELCGASICKDCVVPLEMAAAALHEEGIASPAATWNIAENWDVAS